MAAHIDEHGLQTPTGDEPLMPPTPTRFDGPAPSLTNSSTHTSFVGSPIAEQGQPMLVATDDPVDYNEKAPVASHRRRKRWPIFVLVGVVAAIVIALAIALPVSLVHHGSQGSRASGSETGPSGPASNPHSPTGAISGGNGSQVTTEDGTTFTYVNSFGGFCTFSNSSPEYDRSSHIKGSTIPGILSTIARVRNRTRRRWTNLGCGVRILFAVR